MKPQHGGAALLAVVLFVIAAAAALSVDVPRTAFGVKSDEATYVSMALSAAYDGNLSYERRDLERFWGLYGTGPEGIFLKRGKQLRLRVGGAFPAIRFIQRADPRTDRLYFGKSFAYSLAAAPFVRLFGLNGMLLLHVVLLGMVGFCAYLFLAAGSSTTTALLFTTAFLGASTLPVYAVFLMPEVFNFTLVFVAYFLWAYKEVGGSRPLAGRWTDIAAAVLLGVATYSKPTNGFLVAPLVVFAFWRRRWTRGLLIGSVSVATALLWFALTAAVSGEFNYQGGERRSFYGKFPFDAPDATWGRAGYGGSVTTDGSAAERVLTSRELPQRFAYNVEYFFLGRHFGFVPYFFPGFVIVMLWLFSAARRDMWRVLTLLAFVASVLALLLVLPYTWSGGGGPPGNRYLLSVYPVLFFLMPPIDIVWPAVLAWIGGALFTAKMLVSPFAAAKFPYLTTEKGPARRLPVELTMANDLPVMLDASRSRIPYGDPPMLLYFLDQHAWPPEPPGMWVSGAGRADILLRSVNPIDVLEVTAESPIHTVLTVAMGGPSVDVTLVPGEVATLTVPARGVRGLQSYAYLLTARSSEGFVPHLQDVNSKDFRNLGALMRFRAVVKTSTP